MKKYLSLLDENDKISGEAKFLRREAKFRRGQIVSSPVKVIPNSLIPDKIS